MTNNEKKQLIANIGKGECWFSSYSTLAYTDSNPAFGDKRVARLLVVLRELDRSLAGLEELPQNELNDLVSSAILFCGFVSPVEATYAIASVLQAIEDPGSPG